MPKDAINKPRDIYSGGDGASSSTVAFRSCERTAPRVWVSWSSLSLPPDLLFVSVRSPAHFLYYISVAGEADSGLYRAACWKRRGKQLVRGQRSKVSWRPQVAAQVGRVIPLNSPLTHTHSVNRHFTRQPKWSARWRYKFYFHGIIFLLLNITYAYIRARLSPLNTAEHFCSLCIIH